MFCRNNIQPLHNITWQYHDKHEWKNLSCYKLCQTLTNELTKGSQSCIINGVKFNLVNNTMETNLGIPINIRFISSSINNNTTFTNRICTLRTVSKATNTNEICRFYNTSKGCGCGVSCRYKHIN
jgi:hypothetical protein